MARTHLKSPRFLEGDRLYLEPLSWKHRSNRYLQWLNDPVVCRDNSHAVFPYDQEEMERYLKYAASSRNEIIFAIIYKKKKRHVGNISLGHISWTDRSADIAILIGEKAVWGKGIGREACGLVMDYGFGVLNLHRISIGTTARNTSMVRIAERLGMKREGRLRDALFKDGQYLDLVKYARINPVHR